MDIIFGKLGIQKGVTWADQAEELGRQQAPSKRGKQNKKSIVISSSKTRVAQKRLSK